MSTLNRQNWNLNEPDLDSEADPGAGSVPTAGESSVAQTSGTPGPSQALKTPSKSGIYTPLQKYVTANQAQAGRLGQEVAGKISGKTEGARSALGGAAQAFETARVSKTPTIDTGIVDKFWTGAGQLDASGNRVLTDADKAAFDAQRNAAYQGPMTLGEQAESNAAFQKAHEAKQYADLGSSEYGRQQLVGDLYGTRARGPGMLALDAYLLRKGGMQPVLGAQAGAGELAGLRQSYETQAAQKAAESVERAKAVREDTQANINARISGLGTELGERATQVGAQALYQRSDAMRILDDLARSYSTAGPGTSYQTGTIPQALAGLGITPEQYGLLTEALQNYGRFDYGGVDPWGIYKVWEGHGTTNQLAPRPPAGTVDTVSTIRPEESALADLYRARPLDLGAYAQLVPEDTLSSRYTAESVATPEERARLAALEQMLGQDIDYYSGAVSPATMETGTFDVASALERIKEADERANQLAYTQYVLTGGR